LTVAPITSSYNPLRYNASTVQIFVDPRSHDMRSAQSIPCLTREITLHDIIVEPQFIAYSLLISAFIAAWCLVCSGLRVPERWVCRPREILRIIQAPQPYHTYVCFIDANLVL